MRATLLCAAGALVAATLAPPASALTVSPGDCAEGADFIRNAALSRDNGAPAEMFLSRLDQDLQAIRAFPPALRWFAQDDDDAALLRAGAAAVFAEPRDAEQHHRAFLAQCHAAVARSAGPLTRADETPPR